MRTMVMAKRRRQGAPMFTVKWVARGDETVPI